VRCLCHPRDAGLRRPTTLRVVPALVGDGASPLVDPTGTLPIAARFSRDVARREAQLKQWVGDFLRQDHLGLGTPTALNLQIGGSAADKIDAWATWFKRAQTEVVLGRDGTWVTPYVLASYARGVVSASRQLGVKPVGSRASVRAAVKLCQHELDGIADATEQQATRAMAAGISSRAKISTLVRSVGDRIDKIGLVRGRALAHSTCTSAHAAASLDVFSANGVRRVSLVVERALSKQRRRLGDATGGGGPDDFFEQWRREIAKSVGVDVDKVKWTETGEPDVADLVTRAEEVEGKLDKLEMVEVLTADDDLVCQQCQDIADDGPYDIDDARDLIPAHPNCRCAFVPYYDERFADPKE
jgi:hypothetical protein